MEKMEETEDAELHELLAIGHQHFKYKAQKKAFGVFTSYLRCRRKRKSDVIKAETHFIVQALPKCFSQWQSFTEVEKVKNSNRRKATDFHTEVLLTKYYFEWWRRMEQVCEARTMERMAAMQRDETLLRCHLRVWIVRTRAVLSENRKDAVARVHYRKLIVRGAWRAWNEVVVTSATRRRRFEFAVTYHQQALASDAWLSWRRYVRARRVKKERRADADEYCARCVLRRAVDSWKLYRDQARRRATEAEGRMAAKRRSELRAAWNEWKVETKRLKRKRIGREMATRHRRSVLASVVFTRWREWSAVRIHTRARADERVTAARRQLDRGQLRAAFGRWRAQHRTRRAEQAKTRDAARHHAAKVCAVALQAWRLYRYLSLRKALLRRQADNFSARRLLHDSAACWKRRLQWRREERALTVDALWHWALSLQCKMLDRWRRYAEERRSKRERYEEAMEERRRAMLRSGCRKMLEYNADMIGVTTKLQATRQARTRYSAYHLAWKYGKRWIESVRIRMREDRKKIRSESTWMPPVPISEDEERLITWSASHRMETTRPDHYDSTVTRPDHHDSTVTRPDHHDSTVTRPGPRLPRFLDESLQRDGIFFESATTTTSDHSTRDSVDDSGFRPSPLDRSLQDSPSPRGDHHVLRSRDHVLLPPSAFALPSSSSPPRILLTPDSLLEDGGRRSSQDDDVIVTTSQQGATSMTFVASPSTSRDSVRDELRRIHAQLGEFQHLKRQLKVLKQQKEILLRWATGDGGHARSSSTDSSMLSESMVEHEVAQVSREIEQTASELIERRPEVEKLALRVRVLCARPNS